MRTLTGYFIILLLVPAFISVVLLAHSESKQYKSLHDVLDQNIHLDETKLSETSLILADNGIVVNEIHHPLNRSYVPSGEIPDLIKKIFIVSEDQNFLHHPGFDLPAIGRALALNLHSDEIEQGASTITQQLARNLYLTHEQTYNRKLSELLYAYQLERNFSKEQILEQYLNAIYFQHNAYGVAAAADYYFQKKPMDLSEAEQAFLAAIPNNPSFYDPLKHFSRTKARQERLLDQLVAHGMLQAEEVERAKKEKIVLKVTGRKNLYPDYTSYVLKELTDLVASQEKLKDSNQLASRLDELLASGVIIHTSLDTVLQERTKKALTTYLPYDGVEGSAAILNHEKGTIVALAGGKTYQSGEFNRAYQSFRQPGSAIKPLLVYAPYLERTGASLTENIDASPICIKGYCPQNYGGAVYSKTTLEKAFIYSYNTPAVRLLQQIGVKEAFKDLSLFDFEKVTSRDEIPASAVGGFTIGMSVLEMTEAYTVFSNSGMLNNHKAIVNVTDHNGKLLYKWNQSSRPVWSPDTVEKLRLLMQKTVSSGTARKAAIAGESPGGKTGTTNDFKDLWFIGFNGSFTGGVWVGKDTPQSLEKVSKKSPQLLIWREMMNNH